MQKVAFRSEGLQLIGHLYFPPDFRLDIVYPALIISGSWTTVKEQMSGLYAKKLAENGFITLAFDFRNFGESEGLPRYYENPALKVQDIRNAVSYLYRLAPVNKDRIGAFGVCAGGMYTLMTAVQDNRIRSVVTSASWLHDSEAVKMLYGKEGVRKKMSAALKAKQRFAEHGVTDYVPAISTVDSEAAMYGYYDYYLNSARGAIDEWSADKFAVMSWEDWLLADPMPTARKLVCPTLMIHSDGAVLPQYTKKYFDQIACSDKKLYWMDSSVESPGHQCSFYDRDHEVSETVQQASRWFHSKM